MRSELVHLRRIRRRTTRSVWRTGVRVAAILPVAWVAACADESVVDPPVLAPDAARRAMAMAQTGDRDILVAFYNATDGPNWASNDNWLTDAPLGDWYGVDTDGEGWITAIWLSDNDLSGPIPAELGGLAKLETLWIGSNNLTGSIPPELGNLTSLEQMSLRRNMLSGPIPAELGSLANLNTFYLYSNQLSGTIPPSFQQLSELMYFDFRYNEGLCLPDVLVPWYEAMTESSGPVCLDREVLLALYEAAGGEGWTNSAGWLGDSPLDEWQGVDVDTTGLVSTVDLAGNGLSGGLTWRLGELAGLTALRVGDNALSGRLPSSLRLTPLQELRYANTDLCVPSQKSFQDWLAALPQHDGTGVKCAPASDREILTILYEATDGPNWEESDNWLTDAPLGEWAGVTTDPESRVVRLELTANGLEGLIPAELGGLARLKILGLNANQLTGSIPAELGGLASVDTLALHRNQLTGSIPVELGGLINAEWIAFSINKLSGPIPAELGGLVGLQELHLNNNDFTSVPAELGGLAGLKELALEYNRLTSVPVELGRLGNLEVLWILGNELTSVPAALGELDNLRVLRLGSNQLTSVPPEFGRLVNLEWLDLDANQITSVPAELGRLANLESLWLRWNKLTSIPTELGDLGALESLRLDSNRLSSVPPGLDGMASLEFLDLESNEFASFPRELGGLPNLYFLDLSGNQLTDVPAGLVGAGRTQRSALSADDAPSVDRRLSQPRNPWEQPEGVRSMPVSTKLGESDILRTHIELHGNRPEGARSRFGGFAGLEVLDLSSNRFSGSVPAGLFEFTGITSLSLADNDGLSGPLPFGLTALEGLEDLHTTGTGLCAPPDPEFLDWIEGVTRQRVARCERGGDAAAYLTQAVQSRDFPVPLIAGERALLRVFVTSERPAGASMPPVRATFYRDGAVTHQADIPATADPIPEEIDESSLSKSANAEIPGRVIQPGLEVVIEPDPDGTLDPALGVARRIPAEGRMAVDVRAMPVFEVTLVPFIWQERPDRSIIETVAAMAADPEGHELFERTRLLLPVSEIDATAHGPVLTSTNNGFELLREVEMIRVAEGGRGHYLAVMAGPTGPGGLLGVAYGIGSWSNFSVLDAETIAHEFGHNRNLYHAPCGGAGGPDRYYPYGGGRIGAWGYDFATGDLVPPGQRDFMSYCEPTWTSDYQFTNAMRYRLETETGSIVIGAAAASASSDRALLLWGGLDGEGAPHVRPSFFMDAPAALPEADGPWRLTGADATGAALFSLSFAMAEFTDTDDERAGFSFAVPVTWTEELARVTLEGPGGSAVLDRDTDLPMTILRDPATRRIRGILEGPPEAAAQRASAAAAAAPGTVGGADARQLQVLFSRGIPNREREQR